MAGAPYAYTVGAGDQMAAPLPNPGDADLSVHGPNGFFRHFAGSPGTALQVEEEIERRPAGSGSGSPTAAPARAPLVVGVADAYGPDQRIGLHPTRQITNHTRHSGGWYDIALSNPSDASFRYQLASRLESGAG